MIYPEKKPVEVAPGEIAAKVLANFANFNNPDYSFSDLLEALLSETSPGLTDEIIRYGSTMHGVIVSGNMPTGDTHTKDGAIEGVLYGLEVSKHLIHDASWDAVMRDKFREGRDTVRALARIEGGLGSEERNFSYALARQSYEKHSEVAIEYDVLVHELMRQNPRHVASEAASIVLGFGYTVALGHTAMLEVNMHRDILMLDEQIRTTEDMDWIRPE